MNRRSDHPTRTIYFAGGCFWGTQHYFKQIHGVHHTQAGYANGQLPQGQPDYAPTYQEVYTDKTGFVETVRVEYDPKRVSLQRLTELFFHSIDPTSLNRQGNDVGTRYRTGIYYQNPDDLYLIHSVYERIQASTPMPLAVEVLPLSSYFPAEEYHQDYLEKKPDGYCHLPFSLMEMAHHANEQLPQFHDIQNVVFDFGGVLIDLNRNTCIQAFHQIGYPKAEEMIGIYCPSDTFMALEEGKMTGEELVDFIRQDSGNPEITYEQVQGAYVAFLEAMPVFKLRAIKALRNAGFKTYGLSNINEFVIPYMRDTLFTADGLTMNDYFEYAYLSFEVKALKPDPLFFHRMIAHSGMNPAQTLFIDDSEKNIEAARKLGFQVYLAGPKEDFTPMLYQLIAKRTNEQ